jgi:hypothetical protein
VAIHLLGLPDTVLLADDTFGIGQQFDADALLVAEFRMFQAIVAADAEQDTVVAEKVLLVIRKIGHFLGTTGRSILRVEEQDDVLALIASPDRQSPYRHPAVKIGAFSPTLSSMLFS